MVDDVKQASDETPASGRDGRAVRRVVLLGLAALYIEYRRLRRLHERHPRLDEVTSLIAAIDPQFRPSTNAGPEVEPPSPAGDEAAS